MEVAPKTINQSFLLFAKLKVKGFFNGFLHPIAEIQTENEEIHVGLFSLGLNPLTGEYRLGHTKGILARSLGASYVDILKGSDKESKKAIVVTEERRNFEIERKERSLKDLGKITGGQDISKRHVGSSATINPPLLLNGGYKERFTVDKTLPRSLKDDLNSSYNGGFGLDIEEREVEDNDMAVGAKRTNLTDRDSAAIHTATSDKKSWERVARVTDERRSILKKNFAVDSLHRETFTQNSQLQFLAAGHLNLTDDQLCQRDIPYFTPEIRVPLSPQKVTGVKSPLYFNQEMGLGLAHSCFKGGLSLRGKVNEAQSVCCAMDPVQGSGISNGPICSNKLDGKLSKPKPVFNGCGLKSAQLEKW